MHSAYSEKTGNRFLYPFTASSLTQKHTTESFPSLREHLRTCDHLAELELGLQMYTWKLRSCRSMISMNLRVLLFLQLEKDIM